MEKTYVSRRRPERRRPERRNSVSEAILGLIRRRNLPDQELNLWRDRRENIVRRIRRGDRIGR